MIFINISVANLDDSVKFYTSIGFTKNPAFSDADTACMVLTDVIHVMLHVPTRFRTWVPAAKEIADTAKHTEVLNFLSAESKAEVDTMLENAVKAGGKADPTKVGGEESGMYGRSFEDLDGHIWEVGYMDMSQVAA